MIGRTSRLLSCLLLGAVALAGDSLGTISGVVFNAVTQTPLAGSTVTLSLLDGSPIRTVIADRRGRYLFEQVPPGSYLVKAGRANYAPGRFGQKAWDHVGRPIPLIAGAGATADVHLHRLGVITGMVVDENGEGMPNLTVNAITVKPNSLTGRVSSAGVTDDRGVFRIVGLKPGRYYVATAARQSEDGTGLLPTYFPQTLNRSESQVVAVELDRETPDVQIQPILGKLLHLSGAVPAAVRHAGHPATVTLFHEEESRDASTDPLGQFAFSHLVPGRYTLVVEVSAPEGNLAAYQPLDLYSDRDGLSVSPVAAPELRVHLTDDKGAELNDPQVVILLSRVENGARTPPMRVEPDVAASAPAGIRRGAPGGGAAAPGWHAVRELMPGEWRFFVLCPESRVVDAIQVDGKDALGGFQLMPGRKVSATIRLLHEAGKVHGRVFDPDGQPAPGVLALCYPLDPQNRYRLGGSRSQKTSLLGEYRFAGLPEGDYLIFATEVEDFNPDDQLENLQSRVRSLRVGPSADLTQDIRLLE